MNYLDELREKRMIDKQIKEVWKELLRIGYEIGYAEFNIFRVF